MISSKHTDIFLSLILLISACAPITTIQSPPPEPDTPSMEATTTATNTPLPTDTTTTLPTDPPISTSTPAETPTPIPTYTTLIGTVNVDQLACRYGPGWPYLYFFGLLKGNRLEVIGRIEYGNWIYVQAIGGDKPCWVKADYMDLNGDIQGVEPVYPGKAKLPVSPYYRPTAVLSATRNGHTVRVTWIDIPLRAGDEEDDRMNHYIIEVWRCEAGQLIFDPLATNYLEISFIDEPGCDEPSHGGVIVQEKHGFTIPAEIPWPPYEK